LSEIASETDLAAEAVCSVWDEVVGGPADGQLMIDDNVAMSADPRNKIT